MEIKVDSTVSYEGKKFVIYSMVQGMFELLPLKFIEDSVNKDIDADVIHNIALNVSVDDNKLEYIGESQYTFALSFKGVDANPHVRILKTTNMPKCLGKRNVMPYTNDGEDIEILF